MAEYNWEEYEYLMVIKELITDGEVREDRTKVGTLAKFGFQLRFNLKNNVIPVLTTKEMFFRGIVEELLWFVSGDTNAKTLQDKNIHFWDANSSREYLDSVGLINNKEGDLGPIYGYQWRHWGYPYVDCTKDYTGKGFDQLKHIIETIKTNPTDRRLILSAWNVSDLKQMALPPCHILAQFYVNNNKELSCQMYQRSCDMGLGVPFNIVMYSLLTRMIAQVCDLKPNELIIAMGDTHVYTTHVDQLEMQIEREPYMFPTVEINPNVKDIDQFKSKDFTLKNYNHHPKISMKMAL